MSACVITTCVASFGQHLCIIEALQLWVLAAVPVQAHFGCGKSAVLQDMGMDSEAVGHASFVLCMLSSGEIRHASLVLCMSVFWRGSLNTNTVRPCIQQAQAFCSPSRVL